MLYEITNVQQVPGEQRRRWFFSHEQDLLVWFGDDGRPVTFQLSYNKLHNEHSIRWNESRGFKHYAVDDGETGGIGGDAAPLLFPGGVFPASQVLARFLILSREMPRGVADFVAARLREYPLYRGGWAKWRSGQLVSGAAIGLAIVVAGVVLWKLTSRRED